jgi:Zn-dependent metalloprotease
MEHIKSQSQGLVTTDRDHGHEETDINVKAIFGFALFLLIGGITAHVLLWGMYVYLDKMAEKRDAGVMSPVQLQMEAQRTQATEKKSAQSGQVGEKHAETSKEVLQRLQAEFPSPRLQDDNTRDLKMMRANEDKVLQSYTWIDKNSGAVRIPVARAMEILAERGLPNVAGETPAAKAAAPTAPARQ